MDSQFHSIPKSQHTQLPTIRQKITKLGMGLRINAYLRLAKNREGTIGEGECESVREGVRVLRDDEVAGGESGDRGVTLRQGRTDD